MQDPRSELYPGYSFHPWRRWSHRVSRKAHRPHYVGWIENNEWCVEEIEEQDEYALHMCWKLDPDSGEITESRFLCFGDGALVAAADFACEHVVGKTYKQAGQLHEDLLEYQMRDDPSSPALPKECEGVKEIVCTLVVLLADQCAQLPIQVRTPLQEMESPFKRVGESVSGVEVDAVWVKQATWEEKKDKIEQIIQTQMRPFIEKDGGEIDLLGWHEHTLFLSLSGACTTCPSVRSGTVATMQSLLRDRVDSRFQICLKLR